MYVCLNSEKAKWTVRMMFVTNTRLQASLFKLVPVVNVDVT